MTIEEIYINLVMFYNWTWKDFTELPLRDVTKLARMIMRKLSENN